MMRKPKKYPDTYPCNILNDHYFYKDIPAELIKDHPEIVQKALDSIPKERKEILRLRYEEKLHWYKIAEMFNLTSNQLLRERGHALYVMHQFVIKEAKPIVWDMIHRQSV